MLENLPSSEVNMLLITELWVEGPDRHTDNTAKFAWLIIAKAMIDTGFFYVANKEWHRSFLGLCSLSIAVMDWVMALFMASAWFFGGEKGGFFSTCFIMAHGSSTYGALPVPMICLGVLDYGLDDTFVGRRRPKCKLLRNVALTLAVWLLAGIHSAGSAKTEPITYQVSEKERVLLCVLVEMRGIYYSYTLLFVVLLLAMSLFHSKVFQWVIEAKRLANEREDEDYERSDLFQWNSSEKGQICEEDFVQTTSQERPPLWFSLTMAFGVIWMPYLTMSVVCLLTYITVSPFVSINNMWLACIHNVVTGVLFWAKSRTMGPYIDLPESLCSWQVYWHLSRGTQTQPKQLGVFNPSKQKEKPLLLV